MVLHKKRTFKRLRIIGLSDVMSTRLSQLDFSLSVIRGLYRDQTTLIRLLK